MSPQTPSGSPDTPDKTETGGTPSTSRTEEEIVDTDDEDIENRRVVETKFVENAPKQKYVKRMSEKRLARVQEFSTWQVSNLSGYHYYREANRRHTCTRFVKKSQGWRDEAKAKEAGLLDDAKLSAKALIHDASKNISEPREYQLELFELAKQKNCLAVLDTGASFPMAVTCIDREGTRFLTKTKGSGKTLIACLLIRHMISEELEARSRGEHRRVSFFLVDSVTLVFQQASVLSCNVDAKIGKYYGDLCTGTKMWSQERWAKILDEDQVIVMTGKGGNPDNLTRMKAADLKS